MVKEVKMEAQNYLIIQDNVVTNVVMWNGDTTQWVPPADSIFIPQASTPTKVWVYSEQLNEFVLEEQLGMGAVGFTWDGQSVTTNMEKPEIGPLPVISAKIPTTTIA